MKRVELHPLSLLAGLLVGGVLLVLLGMQQVSSTRLIITGEQQEILSHMSIVYLDDGYGNLVNKAIRISDINVQIVNGLGATNGYPTDPTTNDPALTVTNGLGNLIVGYNELGSWHVDNRTGSHNIVGGISSSYWSYAGFVVGYSGTISGPICSVGGGNECRAAGTYASVSGGGNRKALGDSDWAGGSLWENN